MKHSITGIIKTIIVFCLFTLYAINNNLSAQTDTLFYVPPILDWGAGNGNNRIQLEMLISTNFPKAVVKIRTPNNSFSATVTVLSGITTNYIMPENLNLDNGSSKSTIGSYDRRLPFAVRDDIGLIIQSDFPVSVIQKLNDHTSNVSLNNNEELIILKGSNGLGTQFRAGSQTVVDGAGSWTNDDRQFIGVIASQNGTVVTISGPTNFVGVTLPTLINMNAGESFVMGTATSYDIIAGTRIFSNNPISVTSGSHHTRIAPSLAGDAGIDNLVPYNLLGNQYIAVNGGGGNPYDYVVVVPTQDNTTVRIDGVEVEADLDEAENYMTYSFPSSDLGIGRPHSIEVSKPAYVFHVASRASNNEVGMSLLPQLICTGSKQIGFQIDNVLSNIINFVVPTSALSSFRLNNQSTTALGVTVRSVTGLSNWSAFNVNIASGAPIVDYDAIASEKFHVGILGANGGTGLYGYISGFDQRFTLFDIFNTTLPTTGFSSLGGYCPNTSISDKLTLGSCGQFHSITGFTTKFGSTITTSLIGVNKVDFSISPPSPTFLGCDTIKYIVKNDLGQTDSVRVEACWGPTKVGAGIDFGICGTSAILPAEFLRFGIGRWSQVSGPNTATISNILDRNATVTGLVDGVYNFRWTGSLTGCNVVSDDVLLGVTCAPIYPANADTDGDGIPNDIDLDDDNDGITDVVEYCGINGFTNGNPELITNGDFSLIASGIFPLAANTNWAGWRSSVPYHGNSVYPPDTRIAIQTGNINYAGGLVTQVTFPGDVFYGVSPSSTYLYANGNTTAGAYLPCSQTITGVSPATVYEITSYVSNGVDPTGSSPNDPLLYYFVGNTSVPGSFRQVYDHSDPLSGHGSVDRWDRWTANYTTGPSQTVLGFSIRDFQTASNRDEFAITRISIKKQGYGCLDADPLQDSDFDGVQNYRDSDYCLAIGSSINIRGVCASLDFDTDGIINSIDLDSDNDGIYDLFEAGHNATDANNDGKVDGAVGANGFLNTLEASDATTLGVAMTYTMLNSDSVSGVDFLDLDSDNDGCFDAREAGFLDQNNDGYLGNIPLTVSTISGTVTSGIGYTRPATITGLTYYYRTAASGIGCTPEPTIDGFIALEDVSSVAGSVLTNDYNPLTNSTTGLTITGFNGTITGGTLSITGTGSFVFVPNINYNGITSYTYTICNIQACTTANLVFTIIGVNDAPFVSVTPVTISGQAGPIGTSTITGFGDVDNPISQLTVSGLNPISTGPNGTVNTITGGTVTISGTGAVTFQGTTPGVYTLNYQVCDPTVTCTSAVLTISISGAVPIPTNDGFSTNENTSISGNLLTNDFNPNTNVSVTGLTLNTSPTLLGSNIGTLSVNGAGGFTFVPSAELAQGVTTVTTYRYQVCNNSGCSTAQAVFSVIGVNDAPFVSVTPVTITGPSGPTGVRTITGFGDVDNPISQLTVSGLNPVSTGPNGTVNTITGGTVTISGTGAVTFQSSVPGIYTLNYQVCDPTVTCTSAVLTISISGAVPIPTNDGFSTNENTSISGNLLTNDFNPNTNVSVTGLTLNTSPTLLGSNIGTLSVNGAGAFTFVPSAELAQGVTTVTTYRYQVCNNSGCSTAQVVFTVIGVNDAPFISATPISISGTAGNINNSTITGFGDVDNPISQLTVSGLNPISTGPNGTVNTITGGTVTISGTGAVTFQGTTPGVYTLNYQVCDPTVTCTSAVLTISISGAVPIPTNDGFSTNENTSISGNLLTNDFNPNTNANVTGLTLNTSPTLLGANIGTLSVNGAGAFTFVPNIELAQGVTTVTTYRYQVCNNSGCSTAQAVFSVIGVNDAPFVSVTPVTISGQAGPIGTGTITGFGDVDNPLSQLTVSGLNPVSTGPNGTVNTITGGTVTISGTGAVTFQGTIPGVYTLNYQVCDPTVTCTSAVLTISISGAAPIPTNDGFSTNENTSISGNLLTNDFNPNTNASVTGLTLTTATTLLGTNIGTLSVNGAGAFTFVPSAELAQGVTTVTTYRYQVCNNSGCSTAQAVFSVTGVNDAPFVSSTPVTITGPSGPTGVRTITGFGDVDNPLSQLTVSGLNPVSTGINGTVNTITGGTVTISGNGSVTFQSSVPGIYTLNYQVCDPTVTCTSAVLTISISGAVPVPASDGFSTNENTSISGNLLTNDFNPNTNVSVTGLTLNTSPTLLGANIGTLSVNGAGAFTFVPSAELAQGVTTVTTYRYQVCNNSGCSTAQAVFSVIGVNDAPFVSVTPVTISGQAGLIGTGSITGLGDVDNPISQLTVSGLNPVSTGPNGTVNTITGGTVTISGTGAVTFQGTIPGVYTLNYQVCDPIVTCTSAVLTISISGAVPIPTNDGFSTNENTSISGNLLTNDFNPNTNASVTGLTLNTSPTLLGANIGTLSVNGAGGFTFVPSAELAQGVTTVTTYRYQVCNNSGCSTAQAVFSVTGVNDPPVALPMTISGISGNTITNNLTLVNGSAVPGAVYDVDNTVLTVNGTLVLTSTGILTALTSQGQRVTISGTGAITYASNTTFSGIDTYNLSVCDFPSSCTGTTITFNIGASTAAPVVTADNAIITENQTATGNILSNDTNPLTGNSTGLSITGVGTSTFGSISINTATGAYTFIPNIELAQGQTTITSISFSVCNVNSCTSSNLTITVIGVNDAPFVSVTPVTISGQAGPIGTGTITGFGDVDNPISQLTVSGLNPVSTGPNGTVNTITGGTVTISGTGAVTFQGTIPGVYTLNYQVCDPAPTTCTSAVLTISISGAVPVPANDSFSTDENTSITGNLLTNDFNPNTNASVTGLTLNTSPTLLGANIGTLSVNGAGGFTFVPNIELAEGVTSVTSYNYEVCNNSGCAIAIATFSVTGINDAPIATNVNTSTTSNTSITGTVPFTDPDGIVTVTSYNLTSVTGTFTVNSLGGFSFIPNPTFTGIASFTVVGCDAFICTNAVVTVTVLQNTLNPIANSDINNVLESGTVTGNVLTNDINPITGNNTQLTVTGIVTPSPLGTLIITNSLTGAYTFIPNASVELAQNVITTTSAIYNVCNVNGCTTAQIAITITGINDAPIATNVNTSTTSNTSISGTVVFTDADGLVTVTSQNVTNPTGTFTVSTTGGYTFIPNGTFTGITSFTVSGCDLFTCTSAIVTVTVLQNTLNPIANSDENTVLESGTVTGNVLTNDINPITGNNTQLTVTGIVTQSPLGTLIITNSLTGAYTFIPNANVELAAGITTTTSAIYNVCNVNGCSTAQIAITITGINDAPIATNVNTSTTSNTSITGTVPFTDADGLVTVTSQNVTNPTGTFTVSTTGGYTFIPNGTFTGITSFTISGCDLFTCTSAIVTVTVLQNTLNPTAINDINTVLESGTTTGNVLTNDINPIIGNNTQLTVTGIVTPSPLGTLIITNSLTGAYTFIPNANVELAAGITTTTSAIYNVCNVNGCSTAQIAITITGINDAPIPTNVNTSTTSNTSITGTVLFTDADGLVTVTSQNVTNPTGTFTVSTTGGYTFIPNGTFTGIASFTISGCDLFTCTSAIVTVTVLQNTLNPIANSDINNALESGTVTGNVLTNDINPVTGNNTQLTVTGIVTPSPLGTLIITNSLTGAYTFVVNNSLELAQGVTTTTSAIYNVCNVNGCTTAQIAITITGINDAPIVSTVVSTINNTNPTGTISGFFANDPDGDVLTITAVSMQPNIGTLVINPNGEYVFTPDPQLNYVGTVQFVVSVCDPYTCTSTIVILNVASKPTETENYVIPAGFSPNGDGTNDVFVITPLPSTVRTSLTVFNRWGNEIFATEDYQNDWGGQAGKGAIISRTDGLPAGTYFVSVTFEDASGKVSDKIYKSITIMK